FESDSDVSTLQSSSPGHSTPTPPLSNQPLIRCKGLGIPPPLHVHLQSPSPV
ncbi:hypothetical protein LINPERHAP1_LOCUS8162, partial [Linum perenne]